MGKIKTLLANGDSWAFGSEIMAPEFLADPNEKGEGMGNRYKQNRACWAAYNDYYRIPRIWPTYLGKILDIPEVANISQPSRSNDTIYESTINWILENYITKGKSPDDLLVVIGWSSPERKNIILADSEDHTTWLTLWPHMPETKFYTSEVVKEFFEFYVSYLWVEQEYLKRFVEQNYHLQLFCQVHHINYYVFNSFYTSREQGAGFDNWKDISVFDSIGKWRDLHDGWTDSSYNWKTITKSLLTQWNYVDPIRYVNKDAQIGTFKGHIYQSVDSAHRLCGIHPSPESHESWAKFLAKYIKDNQ